MIFGVLDVVWVTLQPSLRHAPTSGKASCPELRAARQGALCPTGATGCWESPQNPSPCRSTDASKPGPCHVSEPPCRRELGSDRSCPIGEGNGPSAARSSCAGSAECRPSPLFQLLPFPSVLPLVSNRKGLVGSNCRSLGAGLAKGGPHAGRAPSLPRSSRRVL